MPSGIHNGPRGKYDRSHIKTGRIKYATLIDPDLVALLRALKNVSQSEFINQAIRKKFLNMF
jgi:hypothetical protein